jgi:hypothetical protein
MKDPMQRKVAVMPTTLGALFFLTVGCASCQNQRPPSNPYFTRPYVYIMLVDTLMAEATYYEDNASFTTDLYSLGGEGGKSYDLLRKYDHSVEVESDRIFITLNPKNQDTNESYIGAAFVVHADSSSGVVSMPHVVCYGYGRKLNQPRLVEGIPTCGRGTLDIQQGLFRDE